MNFVDYDLVLNKDGSLIKDRIIVDSPIPQIGGTFHHLGPIPLKVYDVIYHTVPDSENPGKSKIYNIEVLVKPLGEGC